MKNQPHCSLKSGHPRCLATLFAFAAVTGCSFLAADEPISPAIPKDVRITISNEETYPVSDLLFGQFMERPSWGGEIGVEAAVLPGTNKLDPRVESLLRTMDIPVVRFPGGSDVDYLDWRDMVTDAHGKGVGRPDSTDTPHQVMIVTNAFGYDEYFRLAAEMKWQSILVVNLREGLAVKPPAEAAAHAAALLAYCVGTEANVPKEFRSWPALRAANGHPEPYRVEYVQIGNETWFFAEYMKKKHGEAWVKPWADCVESFIAALRQVKPDIKIIADGEPLEIAAELHRRKAGVDLYALHRYYPTEISAVFATDRRKLSAAELTTRQVWETLTHSVSTDDQGLAEWKHPSIEQARRLDYRLAMTEWNLNAWWGLPRSEELWPGEGACGLGAAVMVNAMMRHGDTFALATQSMLVGQNWGITGIRVDPKTGKAPRIVPTAEAVTLCNQHHGDRGLRVSYDEAPEVWRPEIRFRETYSTCDKAAYVDVVATRDRDRVYVQAINTHFDQPRRLAIRLDGFAGQPTAATRFCLRFHAKAEFKATGAWTAQETEKLSLASPVVIELPPRSLTIAEFALPSTATPNGK